MGATFVEPGSFWRPTPPGIIADLGVARVYVDTKTESQGNSSITYTRGRVCFPLGAGPSFRIYRDGLLSAIGSKLGMRDVEIGVHREFDDEFAVRSHASAAELSRLWTAEACERVRRHFPKARFECDGTTLEFREQGVYRELDKVQQTFELLSMLGNADLFGRKTLREVPAARYSETAGAWDSRSRPYVTLDLPSRVVVGPEMVEGRLSTVGRVLADVGAGDLDVTIGAEGVRTGDSSAIPAATKPYLARVGRSCKLRLLVEGGRALVTWDGIAGDPKVIHEVAEMLATLVPAGESVYR
jgi:hypothetical protein